MRILLLDENIVHLSEKKFYIHLSTAYPKVTCVIAREIARDWNFFLRDGVIKILTVIVAII